MFKKFFQNKNSGLVLPLIPVIVVVVSLVAAAAGVVLVNQRVITQQKAAGTINCTGGSSSSSTTITNNTGNTISVSCVGYTCDRSFNPTRQNCLENGCQNNATWHVIIESFNLAIGGSRTCNAPSAPVCGTAQADWVYSSGGGVIGNCYAINRNCPDPYCGTVTPTPTPTITPTATITPTPTPFCCCCSSGSCYSSYDQVCFSMGCTDYPWAACTPTITITITPTPTKTPTPTLRPTTTVTPTIPIITLTPTVTPTQTITITPPLTITVTPTKAPTLCYCDVINFFIMQPGSTPWIKVTESQLVPGQTYAVVVSGAGTNQWSGKVKLVKNNTLNLTDSSWCNGTGREIWDDPYGRWCKTEANHADPNGGGYYVEITIPTEPGEYEVKSGICCGTDQSGTCKWDHGNYCGIPMMQ